MAYESTNYRNYNYPVNLLVDIFNGDEIPDYTDPYFDDRLKSACHCLATEEWNAIQLHYFVRLAYEDMGKFLETDGVGAEQLIQHSLHALQQSDVTKFLIGEPPKTIAIPPMLQSPSLDYPIGGLGLQPFVLDNLLHNGISTVGQLLALSTKDLIKMKRIRQKSYEDIIGRLEAHGYDTSHFDRAPDFSHK